jgi:hypothetical protein
VNREIKHRRRESAFESSLGGTGVLAQEKFAPAVGIHRLKARIPTTHSKGVVPNFLW